MTIDIELDDKEVRRALRRIAGALADPSPAMRAIADPSPAMRAIATPPRRPRRGRLRDTGLARRHALAGA